MELIRSFYNRFMSATPAPDATSVDADASTWPIAGQEYPRSRKHIDRALSILKLAGGEHQLPNEIIVLIMRFAKYDRIDLMVQASHRESRRDGGGGKGASSVEPYLETPPIDFLHEAEPQPSNSTDIKPDRPQRLGRIRSVRLSVTGRDQGWVSDRNAGSWSWFEIGRRRADEVDIHQRCMFAHNALASTQWQTHEFVYETDSQRHGEEAFASVELVGLLQDLRNGDCLSIIPVARFAGWQCNVQHAEIEIEVEMWY